MLVIPFLSFLLTPLKWLFSIPRRNRVGMILRTFWSLCSRKSHSLCCKLFAQPNVACFVHFFLCLPVFFTMLVSFARNTCALCHCHHSTFHTRAEWCWLRVAVFTPVPFASQTLGASFGGVHRGGVQGRGLFAVPAHLSSSFKGGVQSVGWGTPPPPIIDATVEVRGCPLLT